MAGAILTWSQAFSETLTATRNPQKKLTQGDGQGETYCRSGNNSRSKEEKEEKLVCPPHCFNKKKQG